MGGPGKFLLVETAPVLTGVHVLSARVEKNPDTTFNRPAVLFELNKEGAALMGRATAANIGRKMAICLDGKVVSAPMLQSRIETSGMITGQFSDQQAQDIALCLRSHALPCKVAILSQKVITRESLAQ